MNYGGQRRFSTKTKVDVLERFEKEESLKKKVCQGVSKITEIWGRSSKNSALGLLHSSLTFSFFKETGTQERPLWLSQCIHALMDFSANLVCVCMRARPGCTRGL